MAIVETKISTRPNTSIPFFSDTTGPNRLESKELHKALIADGKITYTLQLSDDELMQTAICTYRDIEAFSERDTLLSVDLDNEYYQYIVDQQLNTDLMNKQPYLLTGIDVPFTCTTKYNYTTAGVEKYEKFDSFINVIESSEKLQSFVNTGTTLIAVHQYENSEDFTFNHWADYIFTPYLSIAGVTRTINYAIL